MQVHVTINTEDRREKSQNETKYMYSPVWNLQRMVNSRRTRARGFCEYSGGDTLGGNVQKLPIPGLIRNVSDTKLDYPTRLDEELTALRKTRGERAPVGRRFSTEFHRVGNLMPETFELSDASKSSRSVVYAFPPTFFAIFRESYGQFLQGVGTESSFSFSFFL